MSTGKKPASNAGKTLSDKSEDKGAKNAAASALAQAPKGGKKK